MAIDWELGSDGIVVLTMDAPGAAANTVSDAFRAALGAVLDRIDAERDQITGVVITSAKSTFLAGADLKELIADVLPAAPEDVMVVAQSLKAQLRRLETIGKPVVAAINGAAMGGGLELAMACHHRIAADVPGCQVGLPEVQLGVLPGGGGVVRSVRMLGIETALAKVLLTGTSYRPVAAKELGLVDEIVAGTEELVPAAKAWIAANPEHVAQPWDVLGYQIPGGAPSSPRAAQTIQALPATLHKQLKTAHLPAPRAIMAAAVEGAQVDFATASDIESRYFVSLIKSPVARNMIQAFFFDTQAVRSGKSRPAGVEKTRVGTVAVTGTGATAEGIAALSAKAGMAVVRDTDSGTADLVINTSPAPRGGVSSSYCELTFPHVREDVVGIDFHGPIGKAQSIEIIRSAEVSDESLARAMDYVAALRRYPVVINGDGGFFAGRLLGLWLSEALTMLAEGVDPAVVEQASLQAGYAAAPLLVADDLGLRVTRRIADADESQSSLGALLTGLIDDLHRGGSNCGAGFYDYTDGQRGNLWAGLREQLGSRRDTGIPLEDLQDRFMFRQAIATQEARAAGMIASDAEANIGSLFGVGFPSWTGGAQQFINGYPGGIPAFRKRADELSATYGERFDCPAGLGG